MTSSSVPSDLKLDDFSLRSSQIATTKLHFICTILGLVERDDLQYSYRQKFLDGSVQHADIRSGSMRSSLWRYETQPV